MVSRIIVPLVLLACAIGALVSSCVLSSQLHEGLGTLATEDSQPNGVQTPLISTRRLTSLLVPSLATPELTASLDDLMAEAADNACLSVSVTERPEALYTSGANLVLYPSDALLLVTLYTAHRQLGPDHTFTTSVVSLTEPTDGVINGDIYLVGGGDPLLLTQTYLEAIPLSADQVYTPIEDLAQQLVDNGLRLVTGSVIGDASYFDDLRYVPTWPEGLAQTAEIGTLLGLQFDDGWVRFPGVANTSIADADPAAESGPLAAEDPPFYAAALFDDMLEARAVVIRRSPRAEALPTSEPIITLSSIESASVREYSQYILESRDVEAAEMLLKEIGKNGNGQGTTRSGLNVVETTLNQLGMNIEQIQMVDLDGSGLDPGSQTTCQTFATLLDNEELRSFFTEVLPTAAELGPLQDKLSSVASSVADLDRIRGFAGGRSDADVMMGYIDIGLGQELTFVFIANQVGTQDNEDLERLQAQIVAYLTTLRGKPTLDDISPLPIRSS